jgi:hypothetical protein
MSHPSQDNSVRPNLPHKTSPPSEAELVNLLNRLRPSPEARFLQRFENAPWKNSSPISENPPEKWARVWYKQPVVLISRWALAVFILLLVMGSIFFSQSIQATASRLMRYFSPASSDQAQVLFTLPPLEGPDKSLTPGPFSLSISEAEQMAGFKLKTFPAIPAGLTFGGAVYETDLQAVTLKYIGNDHTLLFTQRKLGKIEEVSQIGASAPVEKVSVGAAQGEFVTGGWIFNDEPEKATPAPGATVSVNITWDANVPQHILRWQEGDMLFKIISSGSQMLDKISLIQLAEQIK